MYLNTAAEFRPELLAVVQEAMGADKKFIADLIFPPFNVKTRTGFYARIKKGSGGLLATEGSDKLKRAQGTSYRAIGRTTEQDGWKCVDRGLKEPLDDVNTQELSRFFDVESASAIFLQRNVRIAREQRVASIVFDTTLWDTAPVAVPYVDNNGAFINPDTIDVPNDLKLAMRTIDKRGEEANTMVMSRETWDFLSTSAKLRFYLFGQLTGAAMITREMVAEKFGVSQILIGSSSFSTAKKGKNVGDADLQWVYGNNKIWIGNVQGGPPEAGGAGRTMVLEDTTNGGQLLVVESYRDEDLRSNVLRVREDTDEKVINENSGIILDLATD